MDTERLVFNSVLLQDWYGLACVTLDDNPLLIEQLNAKIRRYRFVHPDTSRLVLKKILKFVESHI